MQSNDRLFKKGYTDGLRAALPIINEALGSTRRRRSLREYAGESYKGMEEANRAANTMLAGTKGLYDIVKSIAEESNVGNRSKVIELVGELAPLMEKITVGWNGLKGLANSKGGAAAEDEEGSDDYDTKEAVRFAEHIESVAKDADEKSEVKDDNGDTFDFDHEYFEGHAPYVNVHSPIFTGDDVDGDYIREAHYDKGRDELVLTTGTSGCTLTVSGFKEAYAHADILPYGGALLKSVGVSGTCGSWEWNSDGARGVDGTADVEITFI